jgi:hypothetical protein
LAKGAQAKQQLEPGTKTTAHRDALLFAAREYERLVRSAGDSDSVATIGRIAEKARRLKSLADGKKG